MSEEKRRPGRPRGASSERLSSGKRGARVMLTIDGESVRKRVKLETDDPAVARVKIEKLQAAEHEAAPAPASDTFREVAKVVFDERGKRVKDVHIELGRVVKHVYSFVGELVETPFAERAVASITAAEVLELLVAKRDEGYSYEQVNKIRQGIKYVLDHAKREGLASKMPPFKATIQKSRAVASDAVLLAYLAWQHPVPRHRAAVRMRQAMSAVSRCIGGQRTNDLHVATWEDNLMVPERGEPDFLEVWVPRTKSQAPQKLETPEGVRPMLRLWWEQSGRPRKGPVFPLLRGERAGQARDVQDSHAEALRSDLRRALGLERWDADAGRGQRGPVGRWVPGRAPTAKEKALFEEGKYTLPVDFHSWRRAWSQALAKVGANVQTAAAVTGHASDLRAHGRYLQNPTEAMVVPAGVVPMLVSAEVSGDGEPADGVPTGFGIFGQQPANIRGGGMKKVNDIERARVDSNHRPLASEGNPEAVLQGFSHGRVVPGHLENDDERRGVNESGQNSRPQSGDPDELLRSTVSAMMATGDIDAATALLEVARRRKAPLPDNVSTLDASRRRKS
jgi:hypothetical protein